MIRIDSEDGTTPLEATSLSEREYLEDDLREWILNGPHSILGEDILIVGREVSVKDIGDAIDLLAIDRDGNVVVIELKRGSLKGDVDFQSLKYAAYTSYWDYNRLRNQFEKFKQTGWGQELYDEETTFTEMLDEFCNDDYTLNQDQRILLVGESIRDRLDIVIRWLTDRGIDVTVVEVQLLEDGDQLYLDAEQTIPVPTRTVTEVSPDTSEEPWKDDGRSWHLNEVSNDETAELLEEVVAAIEDIEFLDGPDWGQKQYLSFKQDRKNRILARTQKTLFNVEIYDVAADKVDVDTLASTLGVSADDVKAAEDDLRGGRPGVRITCRGGRDIDVSALAEQAQDLLTAES